MGYPHWIKPEGETQYHLYASTAAKGVEYPLEPDWVREKFRQTVMFYVRAYRLDVGAFCIMGNHFHLVVRVEAHRELSREELMSGFYKPHRLSVDMSINIQIVNRLNCLKKTSGLNDRRLNVFVRRRRTLERNKSS